jgi:hypothetical protein
MPHRMRRARGAQVICSGLFFTQGNFAGRAKLPWAIHMKPLWGFALSLTIIVS